MSLNLQGGCGQSRSSCDRKEKETSETSYSAATVGKVKPHWAKSQYINMKTHQKAEGAEVREPLQGSLLKARAQGSIFQDHMDTAVVIA